MSLCSFEAVGRLFIEVIALKLVFNNIISERVEFNT